MTFYDTTTIINVISCLFLGLYIIIQNWRSKLNFSFGLFFLSASYWSLSSFLMVNSETQEQAYFWSQMQNMSALAIPIFFYHFSMVFLVIKKRSWPWKLMRIFDIVALFFLALVNTPLITSGIGPRLDFQYWPIAGPLNSIMLAFIALIFGVATFLYIRLRLFFTGIKREQINLILWGMVPAFIGGLSTALPDFGINFPPFGNLFVSLYVFLLVGKFITITAFDGGKDKL